MNRKLWWPIVSAIAALTSAHVSADGQLEMSLGAAVNSSPLYMGSDEQEMYVFPIVDATYHINRSSKFFASTVSGIGFEKTMGALAFGIGIGYRYGLYGPDEFGVLRDTPEILKGMNDPDDTETVKPYIKTVNETWNVKLDYDEGLQKANQGGMLKLGVSYDYHLNQSLFGKLGGQAAWADKQFIDDYFGISGEEVTATRREYVGDSGLYNYGLSGEINYLIDPQNVLFASILVNVFSDDIQKSDIVKDEVQPEITFAYIYFF